MNPRESHELVTGLLDLCVRHPPQSRDIVRRRPDTWQRNEDKRHAMYFPAKASFNTNWNFADDESTWEFSAPVAPMHTRNFSTESCSSASSSPAQEIALRYRAGLSLDAILMSPGSGFTSSDESSSDDSWETVSKDSVCAPSDHISPISEASDIKVVYRQSRADELAGALVEAMEVMRKDGRTANERLVCHRPDCRDTVRDLNALMYHIHLHNIHAPLSTFTHPLRDKHFENSLQPSLHPCPPSSPIKDCFSRILGKFIRHSST